MREPAYFHAERKGTPFIVPLQFNPTELTLPMSAKTTGQGGNVQFQRIGSEDCTVALFFDTFEEGDDVRKWTSPIVALMAPTEGTQLRKVPPTVTLMWAKGWFCGLLKQAVPKYTMFLEDGTPVRAELTVTLQEVLTPEQELAVQGYGGNAKLAIAQSGQRLDQLALRASGDRSNWRSIASANDIRDAMNFPSLKDIGRWMEIVEKYTPKIG